MAWSKNPLIYPKIFHDLLQAAEEGRDKMIFKAPAGVGLAKYKFQFYAFKAAWEAKAERSRRLQNFQLAASEDAKAAKLGRYVPIVEGNQITFINKDVVILEEGISMEIHGEARDSAHDTIDLVAQDQASREEAISLQQRKGRKPAPITPAVTPMLPQAQDNIALKLFGVDTSAPREQPVAPVPQTEEEKALMEQIRREQEEIGDKHGE